MIKPVPCRWVQDGKKSSISIDILIYEGNHKWYIYFNFPDWLMLGNQRFVDIALHQTVDASFSKYMQEQQKYFHWSSACNILFCLLNSDSTTYSYLHVNIGNNIRLQQNKQISENVSSYAVRSCHFIEKIIYVLFYYCWQNSCRSQSLMEVNPISDLKYILFPAIEKQFEDTFLWSFFFPLLL